MTIFITLFLSFFLITPTKSNPDQDCENRWIHIRNLPSQFNADLLTNCSSYPLFENFCSYITNHGLGEKTHKNSRSWYRTDPRMLELIFHKRILSYPCLTPDPNLANAIYLPYYSGIDAIRYLYGPDVNSSFAHGLSLFNFLKHNSPQIWERNKGHDHFLVMARPAWDFSQPLDIDPPIWGTSFLELPEFYNVTALTLESRAYPWQEHAIPYPTSFHPPNLSLFESWVKRVRLSKRNTLMMFAGGGVSSSGSGLANIRRSIGMECENGNSSDVCEILDCSNGVCEHDPIRFMTPMLRASFCLQPPGDTPTRKATFDGILAGCIPVFFEEISARSQYVWHLPEEKYNEFSVFIPKEDVMFKGVSIVDVLRSIPRGEVERMREKVVEMMIWVTYRKHGSSLGLRSVKDAFDIAIEGTLERIKSKLNSEF